jgi:oxygen-independent coproporphyrinogen-3 oxidase
VAAGAVDLPDEDAQADMLELVSEMLASAGYLHYEISNYARPGCEARHNLAYWRNADYLGLGPAASGHAGLLRYQNATGLDDYTCRLEKSGAASAPDDAGFPLAPAVASVERLSVAEAQSDSAFLALRMLDEGLNRGEFHRRYGCDPAAVWPAELARLSAEGLITIDAATIHLTPRGVPLANRVFSAFV